MNGEVISYTEIIVLTLVLGAPAALIGGFVAWCEWKLLKTAQPDWPKK